MIETGDMDRLRMKMNRDYQEFNAIRLGGKRTGEREDLA